MCKVGQNCNVGLEPQQMCHTSSQMDIYRSTLEVIFTITHHTFFSLVSDWFDHHLEASFLSHVEIQQLGFRICSRVFSATLTCVDFGQCLVNLTSNSPKTLIFAVRIFWHKNRGWTLTFDLAALTFYCCYFALIIGWTTLTFVDFGLTVVELS